MTKIRFKLLFPLNSIFTFLFYRVARYTPCISSLAALERHLKRNDRCDRKAQKNVGKGSDKKVKIRELPFSSWNRKYI